MRKKTVEISRFFSPTELDALARESGLVQRESPVSGFKFLLAYTAGLLNTPDGTLAQLAAFLSSACDTNITPQAIDGRISENAKGFMQRCLEKAMMMIARSQVQEGQCLDGFHHVYAIDSTSLELDPSLVSSFRGSGGTASKASLRIQFAFDFRTGLMYMEIGDISLADSATLPKIVTDGLLPMDGDCLFLTDLGYFKVSTFSEMGRRKGCHFLSKLQFGVPLMDSDGNAVDINAVLGKAPENLEMEILLGGTLARLVLKRLPDEVVNSKIRKVNAARRRKGNQITARYRRFLHYAIFITNLPREYGMTRLYALYRIRWQVELIFRVWKSILSIHKIRSAKKSRVLCEVYGKLIVAILIGIISQSDWDGQRQVVLSMHKVARYIRVVAMNWVCAIVKGKESHRGFLEKAIKGTMRLCRKNRQKNKPSIEQILSRENAKDATIVYGSICALA
jgi:hypothetical protein